MSFSLVSIDPKTLVVHTGGIGDFILACPALNALRARGKLELAGNAERLDLAKAAGIADVVHGLDSIGFHTLFSEPSQRLLGFLRGYSEIFVFMRDDGELRERLRAHGFQNVSFHPGVPDTDCVSHASEYFAQCLGVVPTVGGTLDLPCVPGWDAVLHPGSGGREKNWPLENYIRVGEYLIQQGCAVTWLLGPAEDHITLPEQFVSTSCGSLVELGGRLAGSACFIGNDSGITHLAAAVGCPTIAIFGPTSPRVWSPRGQSVRVRAGKPWPSVEDVLTALP